RRRRARRARDRRPRPRAARARLTRQLSLVQRTTRTRRPGTHHVSIQIQGQPFEVGRFDVTR
ncbi:MAG: hypothetical protein M3Y87_32195, partial [Myxococcota bacterium]|nr:hypothetical protein [Myxococcota bacterium]